MRQDPRLFLWAHQARVKKASSINVRTRKIHHLIQDAEDEDKSTEAQSKEAPMEDTEMEGTQQGLMSAKSGSRVSRMVHL